MVVVAVTVGVYVTELLLSAFGTLSPSLPVRVQPVEPFWTHDTVTGLPLATIAGALTVGGNRTFTEALTVENTVFGLFG
jgi:hypothetical protein